MQKHTKRQVKVNLKKKDAFISDVCHRCLCVISDQTEMAKEKEYLRLGLCEVQIVLVYTIHAE